MKKIVRKFTLSVIAIMCLFSMSTTVYAHYPWINVSDYTPDTGSALKITLGWGHNYPIAGFLKQNSVETLKISGPGKIKLNYVSDLEIESSKSISTPGAYIVSATRKPGFYTKTAMGGKQAPKPGLQHVIKCSFSHMCMKAIVNAGEGSGKVDTIVGHPMEIVPLKNPVDMKAGDYLPIQVLCNGKPFSGYVYSTFVGFSTEKEVYAYTTKTDKKGNAKIKILNPGVWMLKAASEQKYPDAKQCDIESFIATLTFQID